MLDYSRCTTDAPNITDPTSAFGNEEFDMPNYESYFKSETLSSQAPKWRAYDKNVTFMQGKPIDSMFGAPGEPVPTRVCQLQFEIPDTIEPPVFLYYRLTNFYQNHRRYVKSFDAGQLSGQNNSPLSGCPPLDVQSNKTIYPCGLIANSMFNDTINSPVGQNGASNYSMINNGTAWASDAKLYGKNTYSLDKIVPPPYWAKRWGQAGYTTENPPPNLAEYWEFQVWMRTAGLPAFSKLALRNDTTAMARGTYQIDIYSCEYIFRCVHGIGRSRAVSRRLPSHAV